MRFVHRVGFRATHAKREEVEALGVKVPPGILLPGANEPLVSLDVGEDHPNWPTLRSLFEQWNAFGMVRTEFSTRELDSARWLEVGAWHHGYPQPDDDGFGYYEATYDLSTWCEPCGRGMKQKAPFQMKGEPKWGRRGIMQLIWVYGELFVKPEVWAAVFGPRGVASRAVMNTKGAVLKTVVQLVVEEEVGVVTEGLAHERCGNCGRVKYLPVTRGAFTALAATPTQMIARTNEYFGSGGQADKPVLVSQDIRRALVSANVRGASFTPVAESA